MRKFIDLVDALMETSHFSEDDAEATASRLMEMTTTDGYWKNPSAKELEILTRQHDLRGVAVGNDVYLGKAYDEVHFGMRGELGLPQDEWDEDDNPTDGFGFNFYTVISGAEWEHDDYQGEDEWLGGRRDWLGGSPEFTVGYVSVFVGADRAECLQNRAFARMVTPRTNAAS